MRKVGALLRNSGAMQGLCVVALMAIAGAAIPIDCIEHTPSICVIRAVTGHECPGCGMVRAFVCTMHGDFVRAVRHNRMCIIVLPLLAHAALTHGMKSKHRDPRSTRSLHK